MDAEQSTVEGPAAASSQPLHPWETVKRAARLCYGGPERFIAMAAVVALPPLALSMLAMWRVPIGEREPVHGLIGLLSLALLIGSFTAGVYMLGAFPLLTAFALEGRPMGWTDVFAWVQERKLFWGVALAWILAGLAVMAGTVMLVVPGFIFLTWFSLGVSARVLGDTPGRKALSESRRLVRPVFKEALLLNLAVFIPMIIINAGVSITCVAVHEWGWTSTAPGRVIPPAITSYLVSTLWVPIAATSLAIAYIDRSGGVGNLRKDLFLK